MDNIYHKEAEFHKMNLQLELKTQALIDEVDTVIVRNSSKRSQIQNFCFTF